MTLILKQPSSYHTPAPQGVYEAGLESWEDLGVRDYGAGRPRHMLRLWMLLNHLDAKGEPYRVSILCTASLHRKSKLYSVVLALNDGVVPTELNLDFLLGALCQVIVSHRKDEQGRTWANIDSVLRPAAKSPAVPPKGFLFDPYANRQAGEDFTLAPAK